MGKVRARGSGAQPCCSLSSYHSLRRDVALEALRHITQLPTSVNSLRWGISAACNFLCMLLKRPSKQALPPWAEQEVAYRQHRRLGQLLLPFFLSPVHQCHTSDRAAGHTSTITSSSSFRPCRNSLFFLLTAAFLLVTRILMGFPTP